MRGTVISYISLRTLCGIKFVHFEMYRSELVDVRKPDNIPPPENKDYWYQPARLSLSLLLEKGTRCISSGTPITPKTSCVP